LPYISEAAIYTAQDHCVLPHCSESMFNEIIN